MSSRVLRSELESCSSSISSVSLSFSSRINEFFFFSDDCSDSTSLADSSYMSYFQSTDLTESYTDASSLGSEAIEDSILGAPLLDLLVPL